MINLNTCFKTSLLQPAVAAAAAEWARDNEDEEESAEAGDTEAAEDTADAEVEAASCVEERTLGGEGSEGNLHGDQKTSQDCSNSDEVTEERRDSAEEEGDTDELSTSDIQVGS